MFRMLLILITLLGFATAANADTIDYWHIWYNKVKIKECNQYTSCEIVLKANAIKKTDVLLLNYFRDTHCDHCQTLVSVEDVKHIVVTKGVGKGTANPIKLSVYDLLKYTRQHGSQVYQLFYQEGTPAASAHKAPILTIRIAT